jgi:hypothetical protein
VVFDKRRLQRLGETPSARRTDLAKMAEGAGIAHTATLRTMEDMKRPCALAAGGKNFAPRRRG